MYINDSDVISDQLKLDSDAASVGRRDKPWISFLTTDCISYYNYTCRVLLLFIRYYIFILVKNEPETGEIYEVDERWRVAELRNWDLTVIKILKLHHGI